MATDIDEKTGLPKWERLGRPKRVESNDATPDPKKEEINDLLTSPGWEVYLRLLDEQAKPVHKALVRGTVAQSDAVSALAAIYAPLAELYKRSSVPFPTYLRILLTGDFND